jgi:hypothetical protein
MIEQFTLAIEERQKELVQALVDGVENWDTYLKLVSQINGLEQSKSIIHEVFEESSHYDGTDSEEIE